MNDGIETRVRAAMAPRAAVLMAAALLFPAVGRAGEPRGMGVLQLAVGKGDEGAPHVILGLGLGLVDTGTYRVDLLGRHGFGEPVDAKGTAGDGTPYTGTVEANMTMVDLAMARRIGRAEVWGGVGWARGSATHYYKVPCTWLDNVFSSCPRDGMKTTFDDGSVVDAVAGSAGARWALGSSFLLDLEARWQAKKDSRMTDGLSRTLGGFAVTFGLVYRTGFLPAWPGPEAAPAAARTTSRSGDSQTGRDGARDMP